MEVGQGYGKVSWTCSRYLGKLMRDGFTTAPPPSSIQCPLPASQVILWNSLEAQRQYCSERRRNLTRGKHEEAIYLLDIIRDSGADNSPSRKLGIQVHKAMLQATDNFWLSSWLKNQIHQLAS